MERKNRFLTRWSPPQRPPRACEARTDLSEVELEIACALNFALELRETRSQILAHSARVTGIACGIGEIVTASETELQWLQTAAQLHEIGMVAVPTDLLTRSTRLSPAELERVRSHAVIGAEIVRPIHGPSTATIIERQYADYEALQALVADDREILLAGILRVADVYDAMTSPRPYQLPVAESRWRHFLRCGSGTKFHPAAVYALLHVLRPARAS
jgi:HD-GYP domain-containing protein (c-di-GMP phosphodiesterase class II)